MASQTVLVFVSVQMKGAVSMNRKKKIQRKTTQSQYFISLHKLSYIKITADF